jgi:hypothetical protein
MPKQKSIQDVIEGKRDLSREAAVESTQIRLDGVGEDPLIKKLASEDFGTMGNREAFDLALQVQAMVRGQASILENQNLLAENMNRIAARMEKYDEDARKWEEDRVKFLENVNRDADKLRVTDPSKRAEISAKVMNEEAQIMMEARAKVASDKIRFAQLIANSPKVTITSNGVMESGMINGQPVTRLSPEVIRIKNASWTLRPGIPTEVPDFVARRWEQIQRGKAELSARQQALDVNRNGGNMSSAGEVTQRMSQIDQQFGTTTDRLS